ncbi:MAG: thioredoxin family protein, partial [Planctomycetaceae bacterium]
DSGRSASRTAPASHHLSSLNLRFRPPAERLTMVLTPSTMLPLGTPAPAFQLPDVTGRWVSLDDFAKAPVLVVMFICNHCPYVKHLRGALAEFGREAAGQGVAVVAISSNDAEAYPADSHEAMIEEARDAGYNFPYLFDESQQVAQAYQAACTPDFYVFDRERKLRYRGQFDDSRPGNGVIITGTDLRLAIASVLAGQAPPERQVPSIGCNIKWRPGNAPAYFGG